MTPHQLLQLPFDADERAVKRAYATLLKQTRPDDDAAAFQRLQEAYAFCLASAKTRVGTGQLDANAAPPSAAVNPRSPTGDRHPAASSQPSWPGKAQQTSPEGTPPPRPGESFDADGPTVHPPSHEHTFDILPFVAELHRLLAIPDTRQMRTWLYAQDALYSVKLKHALRPVVVRAIQDAPALANPNVVAALVGFFGLENLDQDGLAQQLETVLDYRRRQEALDRAVRTLRTRGQDWVERRIGHELAGNENPLRRLFLLLTPTVPSRIQGLLSRFRQIEPRLRHPALNAGAVSFWDQVMDVRVLRRPRVVMVTSRIVVWLSAFFGFLALLVPDERADLMRALGGWCLSLAGIWITYALIRIGWRRVGQWCERRFLLPPGGFSSLFFVGVGVALSWMPGVGPLPAVVGLLFGYLRSLIGKPTWSGGITLSSLAISLVGWWIATEGLVPSLGPDLRAALVSTLAGLPLPVQIWLARKPGRWGSWSHWTASAFAVLAILAGLLS